MMEGDTSIVVVSRSDGTGITRGERLATLVPPLEEPCMMTVIRVSRRVYEVFN